MRAAETGSWQDRAITWPGAVQIARETAGGGVMSSHPLAACQELLSSLRYAITTIHDEVQNKGHGDMIWPVTHGDNPLV